MGNDYEGLVDAAISDAREREAFVSGSSLADAASSGTDNHPWYSIYNWPGAGASARSMDALYAGEYLNAAGWFFVSAGEVFTFGYGSQIKLGGQSIKLSVNAAKGVNKGANVVYQEFDKAGIVRYVGITERQAAVRFGEHLSSGTAKSLLRYEVVPGATNLSRTGARIWEQGLINQYGLQKNGGMLLNRINSIAPKYWWQHGIK